jgi:hypothetical protein
MLGVPVTVKYDGKTQLRFLTSLVQIAATSANRSSVKQYQPIGCKDTAVWW